ncbi:uncharacterized protein I303_107486 [Kwoniella dejecticola CBS 10117]|uniref:SET domain-containing protein n=1 Tax=Kwoniella dejecticola CBS 10117 TaxID=1296121 RepID=A0A1A5ZZT6_9TREE|nr:uncharacterized protein I303_06891 [Kwoniella dejecticola CBS 10117]OBR83326.1 hypothetical protein I303_06891 [Kwoniella dejecticola CBS 10117]
MSSFKDLKKSRAARRGKGHGNGSSTTSNFTSIMKKVNGSANVNEKGAADEDDDQSEDYEDEHSEIEEDFDKKSSSPERRKKRGEDEILAQGIISNFLGRPFGTRFTSSSSKPGSTSLPPASRPSLNSQEEKGAVLSSCSAPGDISSSSGLSGGRDEASHKMYGKELDQAGIEVRHLSGRGRGMISQKNVQPGTVILKVQPAISTLQNPHFKKICHGCFLSVDERNIANSKTDYDRFESKLKLNRCSLCKVLHYCSKQCQVSDWPLHKHECIAFQRLRKMYLKTYPDKASSLNSRTTNEDDLSFANQSSDTIRALARIIWRRRVEREKNGGKDGEWWKQIESLESHLPISTEKEKMKLAQQAQHLQYYLSASIPLSNDKLAQEDILQPVNMQDFGFASLKELMHFCTAFHVNSFTLSSPSLSPIGVSNSPLMALSNHSCDPNAIVVFPDGGQNMELIAIKDIDIGDEILTSYIDISCPYDIRQRDIKDRYRFSCECTLCLESKDTSWIDPRWCVKHPGCVNGEKGRAKMPAPGNAQHVKVQCDSCGEEFGIDAKEVLRNVQKGEKILEQGERLELDTLTAKKEVEAIIPSLEKYLPDHSYPLLSLLRLSTLCNTPPQTPEELDTAIRHSKRASEASLHVYPENHAVATVTLCEYAKLLSLKDPNDRTAVNIETIDKLKFTMGILERAVDRCCLSCGKVNKGGIVGKEMKSYVDGCKRELDHMRRFNVPL